MVVVALVGASDAGGKMEDVKMGPAEEGGTAAQMMRAQRRLGF
jgi:hypothetical protein